MTSNGAGICSACILAIDFPKGLPIGAPGTHAVSYLHGASDCLKRRSGANDGAISLEKNIYYTLLLAASLGKYHPAKTRIKTRARPFSAVLML